MRRENMKNGKWKLTKVWKGETRKTIVITEGVYLNGEMDGVWKYTRTVNGELIESSQVNFKDNLLAGNFVFQTKKSCAWYFCHIKGQFNEFGNLEGSWLIEYKDENDISFSDKRVYSDNNLQTALYRNMSTGEIIYDFPKYMKGHSDEIIGPYILKDYTVRGPDRQMCIAISFWTGTSEFAKYKKCETACWPNNLVYNLPYGTTPLFLAWKIPNAKTA